MQGGVGVKKALVSDISVFGCESL